MLLLYIVSFKEFGSLVCLWHDVKLRKTQLEVRSLTATWSRDLWGHRVVVFYKCVQIVCWTAMGNLAALRAAVFSLSAKNHTGVEINPPPPVRGLRKKYYILKKEALFPLVKDKKPIEVSNMICVLSEIEANAKWNRRLLCDTTLTLESKRRSYSWLSFVVIFCFRAPCTPSYILQQAVEVRSACGNSSTRSYVFSPFQLSLSSSYPFHSSLTHSHFHLDKNSHWLSRGRRCMSK